MRKHKFSDIPKLRWVIADGHLREVSEFSELAPRKRPPTFCPVCERPVTLKLGHMRTHHFAHRPDDVCIVTNPESAVHLNCKLHIYRELQTAQELEIEFAYCRICNRPHYSRWKQGWDKVEVEYRLDSTRPDILLLNNGTPIGAIEVYVTHAIDDIKLQRLQDLAIDWIEIRGTPSIYEEPTKWSSDSPLRIWRSNSVLPSGVCAECAEAAKKLREQEELKLLNREEILFSRLVDLYYRSGKKYRYLFYVKHAYKDGVIDQLWFEDETKKIRVTERFPITKESETRLNEAFDRLMTSFREKAAVVDTRWTWRRWEYGSKYFARDVDRFPFRYAWDAAKRIWVRS